MSKMNKWSYYPRTNIIANSYNRNALIVMSSPEANITSEGNIAGKPDRILNVLTEVTSEGKITGWHVKCSRPMRFPYITYEY